MIGTSGAERVVFAPSSGLTIPWGAWCYRVDEQRAVIGRALNDGGSLFDWLRASLRLPSLAHAEAAVSALGPTCTGSRCCPSGAASGVRLGGRCARRDRRRDCTPPIDMLRAYGSRRVALGEIDRRIVEATRSTGDVIGTGGALLHSPAWMQMVADVLGRPVLASRSEASSHGAACWRWKRRACRA